MTSKLILPFIILFPMFLVTCFMSQAEGEPSSDECGWLLVIGSGSHAGIYKGPNGTVTQALHEGRTGHIIYLLSEEVSITVSPYPETSEAAVSVTMHGDGGFYVPGDEEPVLGPTGELIGVAPAPPEGEVSLEDQDWYAAKAWGELMYASDLVAPTVRLTTVPFWLEFVAQKDSQDASTAQRPQIPCDDPDYEVCPLVREEEYPQYRVKECIYECPVSGETVKVVVDIDDTCEGRVVRPIN